jgi:hypothetical protein
MRFRSYERRRIPVPVFRRDIETLHERFSAGAASASLTEKKRLAADLAEKLFRSIEEASVQRRIPFIAER